MTGGFAGGEAGLQQFLEEGELKFKDADSAGKIVENMLTKPSSWIPCNCTHCPQGGLMIIQSAAAISWTSLSPEMPS